jgi:anthranilate synthase/phosphoribosyltransferase
MGQVIMKKRKSFKFDKPLLDTCGTGGDGKGSFNVSSMAALLCSACGAFVAKHGNRSVSSRSGSADFFSALGFPLDLGSEQALQLLEKTGFTFLFAPLFHSSMKHAAQVRRELGIKTIMNIMGPLLNPAEADYQLIGVYAKELCRPVAEALGFLGKKRVLVVHGLDGLDEISVSAPTFAVELNEKGSMKEFLIDPTELRLKGFSAGFYPEDSLKGGTASENASIALKMMECYRNNQSDAFSYKAVDEKRMLAIREAVLLNAGAALYVYGNAQDIQEGYIKAAQALESGKCKQKLEQIIAEVNLLKGSKNV